MYNKHIEVTGPEESEPALIIDYYIDMAEDIQTIHCSLEGRQFPSWLRLRKFSISSIKTKQLYARLYNDENTNKNMATSLFIDRVYSGIMQLEAFEME